MFEYGINGQMIFGEQLYTNQKRNRFKLSFFFDLTERLTYFLSTVEIKLKLKSQMIEK